MLYNWYTVGDSRNIAPAGWHVPTDEEWKELEIYLGMSQSEADSAGYRGDDEGRKLMAADGWEFGPNGTNESGFTALPGGYRNTYNGNYNGKSADGDWWSFTESDSFAWRRSITCMGMELGDSGVYRGVLSKRAGLSVRLVKD